MWLGCKNDKTGIICYRRLVMVCMLISAGLIMLRGLVSQKDNSVCNIVRDEFNLPCEEHLVTTKDGYTLFVKRIPRGDGSPVLLIPGLVDSAATWLVPREKSLALSLYNAKHDVWLLEKRGRTPWMHDRYSGQDFEFWDFSFDESVDYDLPSMINYVKRFTGKKIASIIGHSEGATIALATLSDRPDLSTNVQSIVGFAPPLTGWRGYTSLFAMAPEWLTRNIHPGLLFGASRIFLHGFCLQFPTVCSQIMCTGVGCSSHENLDLDIVSRVFSNYPRETSLKNVQHLLQCSLAGRTQRFDYGEKDNLIRYGTKSPRPYEFLNLSVPTVLFYGTKDRIVPFETVNATSRLFNRKTVQIKSVPYGHLDYLYASDAKNVIYDPVINFIQTIL